MTLWSFIAKESSKAISLIFCNGKWRGASSFNIIKRKGTAEQLRGRVQTSRFSTKKFVVFKNQNVKHSDQVRLAGSTLDYLARFFDILANPADSIAPGQDRWTQNNYKQQYTHSFDHCFASFLFGISNERIYFLFYYKILIISNQKNNFFLQWKNS